MDSTEQQAKAAALKDTGFTESEVTFTKCRKDCDDDDDWDFDFDFDD